MTGKIIFALALLLLPAPAQKPGSDWEALQSLAGEWIGVGTGTPGQGSGAFSFTADLQGRVLDRRNRAGYPAANGRPAALHDDLTVHYRDPSGGRVRAIYFDNEGHVIHYAVDVSADHKRITLLSDAAPSEPRFRFTYTLTGARSLTLKFEIAPPGKPDRFATYLEGGARRK